MAIVNLKSTLITNLDAEPKVLAQAGTGGGIVRNLTILLEVAAGDSDTSTYRICRLPSNVRLIGSSDISLDDLASSGSPTIDIGVGNATGLSSITEDPDAINDGIDAAAAATRTPLIGSINNYGKRLFEFVSGQTVDPKVDLEIFISIVDADVNVGGTIVFSIDHTFD